jgi:hypothetical protein
MIQMIRIKMAIEITTDLITFLLVILVPFGSAVAWLTMLHTRLRSIDKDVDKLQDEVRDISIKFGAHLLATKELFRSGEEQKQNE